MRVPLWMALAALAGSTSCLQLDPRPTASGGGLVEPEVFEVVRAANSRAAVEYLSQKHQDELRQMRLLEEQIQQLVAAQAGLAVGLEASRDDFAAAKEEAARLEVEVEASEAALTQAQVAAQEAAARQAEAEQAAAAAAEATAAAEAELAARQAQLQLSQEGLAELQVQIDRARDLKGRLETDEEFPRLLLQLQTLLDAIDARLQPEAEAEGGGEGGGESAGDGGAD